MPAWARWAAGRLRTRSRTAAQTAARARAGRDATRTSQEGRGLQDSRDPGWRNGAVGLSARRDRADRSRMNAPGPGRLDRPARIDLLIGCGGWSLPLLALSYAVVDGDVPRWSAVFYGLALVCNYPHYMATIYRAYGRDDRGAHRLYTHWLTGGLVALGIAAHAWFPLVPWLFTAYVMWSPWHYTGQNFGVLMMFLRRAGVDVSAEERRRLHLAFLASFIMLLAAFNTGASADPLVLSLGLPPISARIMEAGAGLTFLVGGLAAFVPLARRAPRRALLAPLTLYSTQALWFVLPVAVNWMASIDTPQTRYSSGMLAVMHSAIPVDHALLREARRRAGGPRRRLEPVALLGDPPRRRRRALPADPMARQLRLARRLHRQHLHRGGDRQPAPFHDRRRGVEAPQSARRASAGAAGWDRRGWGTRGDGRGDGGCRARTAPGVHVGLAGGTRRGARPPRRGRSVALRPGDRPRRARPAGRSGTAQPVRQRHLPAPGPGREQGRRSGGGRRRAAARRRCQPAEPAPRPGAGAPADRSQPVRRGLPAMPGDAGAMA